MTLPKLAGVPVGSDVDPCCCGAACCLYSAAALSLGSAGGGFDAEDLPDAITLNGISKSKSGTGYGNTTDGVILEDGVWAVYVDGVRTTQECLIDGLVEDQFIGTYDLNLTLGGGESPVFMLLTRVGLCQWTGEAEVPGRGTWYAGLLFIDQANYSSAYVWELSIIQECSGVETGGINTFHADPQSAPPGTFDGFYMPVKCEEDSEDDVYLSSIVVS